VSKHRRIPFGLGAPLLSQEGSLIVAQSNRLHSKAVYDRLLFS